MIEERTVGGLRCSEVLELLADFVDGQLGESEGRAIEAHLIGCDVCARFGERYGALVAQLRQAGQVASQDEPRVGGQVRQRLLVRLRQERDRIRDGER